MSTTPSLERTRRLVILAVIGILIATAAVALAMAAAPKTSTAHVAAGMRPAAAPADTVPHDMRGGVADGHLPDEVTPFDDAYPGVVNLEPALLAALRAAATDSADDGIQLTVKSAWRSAALQNELRRAAVSEYGSDAEAARWVATAETSPHVSGDAVDIGGADATAWLSAHGSFYGLCQIYLNEPWHYELLPDAARDGCPTRYADPTEDPRMQQ